MRRAATRSSTSPPRPTSTARSSDAASFVRTNVLGTSGPAGGRARERKVAAASCTSPPTRSTAASREGASPRERPARTQPAPTPPPRPAGDLLARAYFTTPRPAGHRHPRSQQLRAVPVSRRSSSRSSSPTPSTDKPLPLYGDGRNVRDWLYVDDHCAAIDCVLAPRAASARSTTSAARPTNPRTRLPR